MLMFLKDLCKIEPFLITAANNNTCRVCTNTSYDTDQRNLPVSVSDPSFSTRLIIYIHVYTYTLAESGLDGQTPKLVCCGAIPSMVTFDLSRRLCEWRELLTCSMAVSAMRSWIWRVFICATNGHSR